MLTLVKWLLRIKDKEHFLRAKYNRAHPHFSRYLAVDVIISVSLAFGAAQFGIAQVKNHTNMVTLTHAGGVVLNANQLIHHVPLAMHNGTRYWLGSYAGASYITNCITPGVLKVTYLAEGQKLTDGSKPLMTITAFENKTIYDSGIHNLPPSSNKISANTRGDLLTFNDAMSKVLITRVDSQEIITIDYATAQSLPKMILDSQNLIPLG